MRRMASEGHRSIQVTVHALGRWAQRVLLVGQADAELREQAQRAWEEGRVIAGSRPYRQYRLWRDMTWVFSESAHSVTLVTVHTPDEPEEEADE